MAANLAEIKKNGFIQQRQKSYFSLRLRVVGGIVDTGLLQTLTHVSQVFAKGQVHLTSRQSVEIPFIKLKDIDKVREVLAENGVEAACVGPGVRTITACIGSTICAKGIIDSGAVAKAIEGKFRSYAVPHKFKIGVTGCTNNCLKVEANDLGIKGAVEPAWLPDQCVYCGLCAVRCPVRAISVAKGVLTYDRALCTSCGKCVKCCPKGSWSGKPGYLVFFGGIFGNTINVGRSLLPVIHQKTMLLRIVGAALAFFAEHGKAKERFAFTLERVGWEKFVEYLVSQNIPIKNDGFAGFSFKKDPASQVEPS